MNTIDEQVQEVLDMLNQKLRGSVDYNLFSEIFDAVAVISVPNDKVLVSKTIPDSVVEALENSSYHWGDTTRDYFTPIYEYIIECQGDN